MQPIKPVLANKAGLPGKAAEIEIAAGISPFDREFYCQKASVLYRLIGRHNPSGEDTDNGINY